MTQNNDAPSLVDLHTAHMSALDAFQADPTKPELKDAATAATTKYREAFDADIKARNEATAKSKPPEKYDIKLPKDSKLDGKVIEDVASFAKANGLSNEKAQAILERESTRFAAYVEEAQAQQMKQIEDEQKAWIEELKTDKEIGGEKLPKTVELTKRFLEKVAPKGMVELLDQTGIGNNPMFIRFVMNAIKAGNFAEDTMVSGASGGGKDENLPPEKRVYPKMQEQLGRA